MEFVRTRGDKGDTYPSVFQTLIFLTPKHRPIGLCLCRVALLGLVEGTLGDEWHLREPNAILLKIMRPTYKKKLGN